MIRDLSSLARHLSHALVRLSRRSVLYAVVAALLLGLVGTLVLRAIQMGIVAAGESQDEAWTIGWIALAILLGAAALHRFRQS